MDRFVDGSQRTPLPGGRTFPFHLDDAMIEISHAKFGIGNALTRLEDDRFITGSGQFTDDFYQENQLHGFVVRSPIAAGKFRVGDLCACRDHPGVHRVFLHQDIADLGHIPCQTLGPDPDGTKRPSKDIPLLCKDTVYHLGDAIAFVIADSVEIARDAAELIEINFDPFDNIVVDTEAALADDAPRVHADLDANVAFIIARGNADAAGEAFQLATHVSSLKVINNRLVSNYMEPRAALASWSETDDRFTITVCSQGVHSVRRTLAGVLGIDQEKLRVLTKDVGGGFGTKVFVYREYALCLFAAGKLGRPIKWTCDRSEHFLVDAHGRDNVTTARMAMDAAGRFLAVEIDILANMGAYLHTFGPFIPALGISMTTGVYHIPAIDVRVRGVYTNTTPTDAYRGAGRPEACYLIERLVDRCAIDLGIGVDEIRRRNMIRPEQLPYTSPTGRMYDTGEYQAHMEQCMERAGWADFEARNAASKAHGRFRGIGMATYIEACAFAGAEPAFVELHKDGKITLKIGTQSNGQGHATAYSQMAAEKLGVDYSTIEVRQGDSDELAAGGGTGGSRSIPLGAPSAARAGANLAEKLRKIAADELEADAGDIELVDGTARIVGTDRSITFAAIAEAANQEDLKAEGVFKQEEATYPNGTHICEVEIDPDTGVTQVLTYTIVDDFGVTVNPLLLAGQIHGGTAQGIGQCLHEQVIYDQTGQLLTASFMDYRMPRAADMPMFDFATRNVPSTTNELGIKGAGEAGTVGSTPATMNAVIDAMRRQYGVVELDMPVTPFALWQVIQHQKG